jgi:signal transduction histidine kinase
MDTSGRLFLRARCRAQVLLCSHCDRGNRYCGRSCSRLVTLSVVDGRELLIFVVDAGRGIDPSVAAGRIGPGRLGLRGVKERLAHLGGSFEIVAPSGGGSRAFLRVPLRAASAAHDFDVSARDEA